MAEAEFGSTPAFPPAGKNKYTNGKPLEMLQAG